MKTAFRIGLVLVTVAIIQHAVAPQVRIAGVTMDLLLLVAIAAGLVGGPDDGAVVGFLSGLLMDLIVQGPLGLFALTYCAAGFVTGLVHGAFMRDSRIQTVGVAALVSAVATGFYALAAQVLGRSGLLGRHFIAVIVVVVLINALLVLLAVRIMTWAFGDEHLGRAAVR